MYTVDNGITQAGVVNVGTKTAVEQLDSIYGTHERNSSKAKNGYYLLRHSMVTSDGPLINSDQVQSVIRAKEAKFSFVRNRSRTL